MEFTGKLMTQQGKVDDIFEQDWWHFQLKSEDILRHNKLDLEMFQLDAHVLLDLVQGEWNIWERKKENSILDRSLQFLSMY